MRLSLWRCNAPVPHACGRRIGPAYISGCIVFASQGCRKRVMIDRYCDIKFRPLSGSDPVAPWTPNSRPNSVVSCDRIATRILKNQSAGRSASRRARPHAGSRRSRSARLSLAALLRAEGAISVSQRATATCSSTCGSTVVAVDSDTGPQIPLVFRTGWSLALTEWLRAGPNS